MSKDSARRVPFEENRSGGPRARVISLDDTANFMNAVRHLEEAPAVASVAKRAFDVALSAVLLVLAAPVLVVAMLLVRLTSRGPALFVQKRIGFEGRKFDMYKLRTMRRGAERVQDELASCL